MKYLVTGGTGFIGSHLVDELLKYGNEVIVIDRSIKWLNIKNQKENPKLKLYHLALEDNIADLFKDVDYVFHLAALTRPQWSIKYPYETSQANVMGTIKVLEHARDNKVKRVIYASTSNLYGDQELYPTPENVKPNPMNSYALSKYVGELYCKLFQDLYGLEWNAIRPFNAYGNRMPISGYYTSAAATFINALKNDLPIETFGTGEQRRDYIYIKDIIDQMMMMCHSKIFGETFNCGFGKNYSINEVLALCCHIFSKKVEPKRLPAQFEPKGTLADISKAKDLLGWTPNVDLEEGLMRTIYDW